ncbi:uncharacterized protein BP5553_09421 [Venustampulla echinocandica]|uniref:Uncharacterized protein n=1 Tax=Venustampulla echinocandica TaxID=2656787 RepID=A0A370TCN2_9HELO|nr:uncharacterized protein BP5553_09421 [Venustampulla echinocandica]RDL32019.1 hypothetical protein BP5553_09421 [Venustampulla echinocandica]
MSIKSFPALISRPMTWLLGLHQQDSFLNILRSQTFTYPVSREFLTSTSAQIVNPRDHRVATDQVSTTLPASSVEGLNDEAILALFTTGFFGGVIFAPERAILRMGVWKWLPAHYSTFNSKQPKNIIWRVSDIPKTTLVPIEDVLFGSFKVIDAKIKSTSDPSPSYVDFGFGSDSASFAGCHRFCVIRNPEETKDGPSEADSGVEIRLEHFRCNPVKNVDSWAEYIPWLHYWYAKLLFADGIRSLLRR